MNNQLVSRKQADLTLVNRTVELPVYNAPSRDQVVVLSHHTQNTLATPQEQRRKIPLPLLFFATTWIPVIFGVQAQTLLAMGIVSAILLVFSAQK